MNKTNEWLEESESISLYKKCFGCDNQIIVEYSIWPKNQPITLTCSNCGCKQEVYPQHRVVK